VNGCVLVRQMPIKASRTKICGCAGGLVRDEDLVWPEGVEVREIWGVVWVVVGGGVTR